MDGKWRDKRNGDGAQPVDVGREVFAQGRHKPDNHAKPDAANHSKKIRRHKQQQGTPEAFHQLAKMLREGRNNLVQTRKKKRIQHAKHISQQPVCRNKENTDCKRANVVHKP